VKSASFLFPTHHLEIIEAMANDLEKTFLAAIKETISLYL
jgi:hypothetical protein